MQMLDKWHLHQAKATRLEKKTLPLKPKYAEHELSANIRGRISGNQTI